MTCAALRLQGTCCTDATVAQIIMTAVSTDSSWFLNGADHARVACFLVMFTEFVSVTFPEQTAPRHSRIAPFLELRAACCPLALSRRCAARCWPVIRGPRCLLWLGVTLVPVNLYAGLLSLSLASFASQCKCLNSRTSNAADGCIKGSRCIRDRQGSVFSRLDRCLEMLSSQSVGTDGQHGDGASVLCWPWGHRRLGRALRTKLGVIHSASILCSLVLTIAEQAEARKRAASDRALVMIAHMHA